MGEEKNKKDSKKHPKNPNNKKIPKALVAEKESSVSGYYSSYMTQAQLNGHRGSPARLFDMLEKDEQDAYEQLAAPLSEVEDGISLYTAHGEQIKLDKTKRLIILVLQEIYNEQVKNKSNFNDDDWMRDDSGTYGRLYTSAYKLACRIYNTNNPGSKTDVIMKHLRQLAGMPTKKGELPDDKWKYFLVYKEFNKESGEFETIAIWDNLIKLGLKISGTDSTTGRKKEIVGFIKLHDAFFANLRRGFIHTEFPTSTKLVEYFKKIPTAAAMSLDGKLKLQGSRGHFVYKCRASELLDQLAPTEYRKNHIKKAQEIVDDAIEANKHTGLLLKSSYEPGVTGENVYIFYINEKFFPKKKSERTLE